MSSRPSLANDLHARTLRALVTRQPAAPDDLARLVAMLDARSAAVAAAASNPPARTALGLGARTTPTASRWTPTPARLVMTLGATCLGELYSTGVLDLRETLTMVALCATIVDPTLCDRLPDAESRTEPGRLSSRQLAWLLDATPYTALALEHELGRGLARRGLVEVDGTHWCLARATAHLLCAPASALPAVAAPLRHVPGLDIDDLVFDDATADQIHATLAHPEMVRGHVHRVRGPRGSGCTSTACALACVTSPGGALVVDARELTQAPAAGRAIIAEAVVRQAALVVELDDSTTGHQLVEARTLLAGAGLTVFVTAPPNHEGITCGPSGVTVDLATPTLSMRERLWQRHLPTRLRRGIDLGALAFDHELTTAQIARVANDFVDDACRGRFASADDAQRALVGACRRHLEHDLDTLATRLSAEVGLDDMVLTPDVRAALDAVVAQARALGRAARRPELARFVGRLGVIGLFHGAPGTGKTMAARAIGHTLDMPVYRVDTSRIVSKYIGETSQNLARLLDEAERARVVLLFDEADSLFARRTGVQSSQDRHANQDVNYLLTRLEAFRGVALMTTNFADVLDDAIRRRLDAEVEFPLPDVDERELLWRRIEHLGLALDDDLDFAMLAEHFELGGGLIHRAQRQAVLAHLADPRPVSQADLVELACAQARSQGQLVRLPAD